MGLTQMARRVVLSVCFAVGSSIGQVGVAAAWPDGAPVEAAASAAAVQPVGGDDYPWKFASMDAMSPLRFAYRNCTDYVAFKLNQQLGGNLADIRFDWSSINAGGNGHASAWRDGAAGKYMVDQVPLPGAVAWWGTSVAGGYGHVALVTAVSADGSVITLHEYNTGMDGRFQDQPRDLHRGQAGWPEAFIHVADHYQDGAVLRTVEGERYVIAGGAALPLGGTVHDALPTDIMVTRHQIGLLPTTPRDGTYLQDVSLGTDYVVRGGTYRALAAPGVRHALWGQDLGTWADAYLTPGRSAGEPPAGERPASIAADLTGMGVGARELTGVVAVQ